MEKYDFNDNYTIFDIKRKLAEAEKQIANNEVADAREALLQIRSKYNV